jgi:hypothetical protein
MRVPLRDDTFAASCLPEFLGAVGDRDLWPWLSVIQGTFPRIAGKHLQARWLGSSTSHVRSQGVVFSNTAVNEEGRVWITIILWRPDGADDAPS